MSIKCNKLFTMKVDQEMLDDIDKLSEYLTSTIGVKFDRSKTIKYLVNYNLKNGFIDKEGNILN